MIRIGLAVALSPLGAGLLRAQAPAPETWHSLEIPGGTAGLLEAAGLDPGLPRWQSFHEATRRLEVRYGDGASVSRLLEQVRAYLDPASPPRAARMAAGPLAFEARGGAEPGLLPRPTAATVPLPLAPAVWSKAVFGRPLSDDSLALARLALGFPHERNPERDQFGIVPPEVIGIEKQKDSATSLVAYEWLLLRRRGSREQQARTNGSWGRDHHPALVLFGLVDVLDQPEVQLLRIELNGLIVVANDERYVNYRLHHVQIVALLHGVGPITPRLGAKLHRLRRRRDLHCSAARLA